MRFVLAFLGLLICGSAHAQCTFSNASSFWGCQTTIPGGSASGDVVLGYRSSLGQGGQAPIIFGQVGSLTRSIANRPTNGGTNGPPFTNSGISWFGAATVKTCSSNPFGNEGTWVGCQLTGTWQAADTYSQVEIIGAPGSGIALAAATRSSDNTASQSYTQYIYCESDGTLGGTITGRSCEDAYHFAWNRADTVGVNGNHYAVGLEIDCQNEETLTHQSPYALNNASFCGNLLLAAGGDYTSAPGRTQTATSYGIGFATQNAATSKFDAGIIFATNAFLYTHGPNLDQAAPVVLGQNMAVEWLISQNSLASGAITSNATTLNGQTEILFNDTGLAFTNGSETIVTQFTPTGKATFSDRVTAPTMTLGADASPSFFPILDSAAGASRLWTYQDASVTVTQVGLKDAASGANAGDNYYIDDYSDAGVFLQTAAKFIRATGWVFFPNGIEIGGALNNNAVNGFLAAPTTPGTPTGTPAPPTASASISYDLATHVLNIYDTGAASWYHVALSLGGG